LAGIRNGNPGMGDGFPGRTPGRERGGEEGFHLPT
jgi:hypothetical protein